MRDACFNDGDESGDDKMIGIVARFETHDEDIMIASMMKRCMAVITVMKMKLSLEVTMVLEMMMLTAIGNDVSPW